MAEYRTIRMSFWNDPYIEELDPKVKLLYIYLFTSPYTNNVGVLEATRRKIAFETGLSTQDVDKGLEKLEQDGKVVCDSTFNLVFVVRFIKHQTSTSPKLIEGMQKLAVSIPSEKIARTLCILYPQVFAVNLDGKDTVSIPYADGMYTLSIPSGEIGNWKLEIGKGNVEGDTDTVSHTRTTFLPPTIEQVEAYCNERNNFVDPQKFVDFYASKGWMVGKNKMRDWKAAVRTWEKERTQKPPEERPFWDRPGVL